MNSESLSIYAGLSSLLQELEVELHLNETRQNPSRLDELLHPQFVEIGRGGRIYTREEILQELDEESARPEILASDFKLHPLGEKAAMLTYQSSHRDADGELTRTTLRSSLWVRHNKHWRMRFHQGTAKEL